MSDDSIQSGSVAELAIVKDRVEVELVLDGGHAIRGELFLLPHVVGRGQRERLVDMLAEAEPFVPMHTAEGVVLLRRDRVVMARVEDPEDANIVKEPDAVEIKLSIMLAGGAIDSGTLDGLFCVWPPSQAVRMSDELNEESPFLSVLDEDGRALVVAKRYVVCVTER